MSLESRKYRFMVEGEPMFYHPSDDKIPVFGEPEPAGDTVAGARVGDTVTFTDGYGWKLHAAVTHVEPPEETHNEENSQGPGGGRA